MSSIDSKVIFLIVFLNANRGSFNLDQSEGKKPIIAKVGQSVFWTEAINSVVDDLRPFLILLLAQETYNHVWTWKGRKSEGKGKEPFIQGWASVPSRQDPQASAKGQLRRACRSRSTSLPRSRA